MRAANDDFVAMLHGEITTEEYVKRLKRRVRERRSPASHLGNERIVGNRIRWAAQIIRAWWRSR